MHRQISSSKFPLIPMLLAVWFGSPCEAATPPAAAPAAKQARPLKDSRRLKRPNVVIILADDLGYGDVGCYGATKVKTPNIDRLAREGRRFTDAHSPSSVCTPSRYALLTGEYAWRHKAASGILQGNAPLSIPLDRLTLARLFQSAGYATGAVGKWHLGLGEQEPDFNKEIRPGPLEIGFDYFFGFAATGDRTPCVFIENHHVVGAQPGDPIRVSYTVPLREEPIGREHPELLKVKPSHGHSDTIINGISRIGYMSGGHAARWHNEEMADVLTRKAIEFIERSRQRPFFLYFATQDIHVPRVPNPRFAGKSPHGTRGDVIQEFDWSVGEVLAALDRLKLADNTLVIVTSDNGGVMDDGYQDGSGHDTSGHRCNGPLRGYKAGLFEGGHRVPFVARWKGHIPPGVSDQLLCHVDFLATCADLLGRPLAPQAVRDSVDELPILFGTTRESVRRELVHHTGGFPGRLAIRSGTWKLIPAAPRSKSKAVGDGPYLFNLAEDLAEAHDRSKDHPEKVRELASRLETIRANPTAFGPLKRKKLIEFGADEPNTEFMRANVDRMERVPFDGFVFHPSGVNFTWEMWGRRRFALAELQKSIDDLRATKFRRLTDRFLRVNVTPGDVDWFDDDAWNIVLDNFALAAQIAKAGGAKGFLFDTEQYQGSPFCYREQKHKETRSFAQYQAKVRQRGEEWMRTVNGRFADITILLTFGYEITRPRKGQKDRSDAYGLLADFLDGALSVNSKETRFVDAWELSYGFKRQNQFQQAYDATTRKGPEKWTSEPENFRRHVRVGFGIWLDNDWDIHGWNDKDFAKNYFTPAAFEESIRAAITVSDEYVWIYSGQPRWWTNEKLPRAYVDALENARKSSPQNR
jgi:arylsulfatase A-like enzyme